MIFLYHILFYIIFIYIHHIYIFRHIFRSSPASITPNKSPIPPEISESPFYGGGEEPSPFTPDPHGYGTTSPDTEHRIHDGQAIERLEEV